MFVAGVAGHPRRANGRQGSQETERGGGVEWGGAGGGGRGGDDDGRARFRAAHQGPGEALRTVEFRGWRYLPAAFAILRDRAFPIQAVRVPAELSINSRNDPLLLFPQQPPPSVTGQSCIYVFKTRAGASPDRSDTAIQRLRKPESVCSRALARDSSRSPNSPLRFLLRWRERQPSGAPRDAQVRPPVQGADPRHSLCDML